MSGQRKHQSGNQYRNEAEKRNINVDMA